MNQIKLNESNESNWIVRKRQSKALRRIGQLVPTVLQYCMYVQLWSLGCTNIISSEQRKICLKPTTLYDKHKIIPTQMYWELGPEWGTTYHKSLESKIRFTHWTLLGKVMYAYMACRPDICCAVTTLSKFSGTPSEYHYWLLKQVAFYLQDTLHYVIHFKQSYDFDQRSLWYRYRFLSNYYLWHSWSSYSH